jgi:carboxypeptidase C (cathepsin A)
MHAHYAHTLYTYTHTLTAAMLQQWDGQGVTSEVTSVLEAGIPLLFFNGQYDLICNHIGNQKWLHALEWSGAAAYRAAQRSAWVHTSKSGDKDKHIFGYVKVSSSTRYTLCIVIVYMVQYCHKHNSKHQYSN